MPPLTTIYGNGTRVIGDTASSIIPQTLHPDVSGYIARLKANGYTPSLKEINAVNNLVYKFIGIGVYDFFQVIYPVIGNSGTTSTLDLKNLCNGTAVNSWTFASTGMKSNGGTPVPYIDTGYNPFVRANQDNMHLSIYVRNSVSGTIKVMGVSTTTTQFIQIVAATNGNVVVNGNNGPLVSPPLSNSSGLWIGCRTNSTNQQLYYNGGLRGTNTTVPSINFTNVNRNYYMGAINQNGAALYPSTQEIAFASIGVSLDAVDAKNMYAAVQAYQTELGRQI